MSGNAALLIIDMQNALVEVAYKRSEVLKHIGALLERARAAGATVIYLQQDHESYEPMKPGAFGWLIHSEIEPQENEPVIRKRSTDSFFETSLEQELWARGVERLVVTGMTTEYCVDSTSRSALSHGFDVTLVEDAHTTVEGGSLAPDRIIAHHNTTLEALQHPGYEISVLPESGVIFSSGS